MTHLLAGMWVFSLSFHLIHLLRLFELHCVTFRDKFYNAWISSDILECVSEIKAVPEIVMGECRLSLHSAYTCSLLQFSTDFDIIPLLRGECWEMESFFAIYGNIAKL